MNNFACKLAMMLSYHFC